MPKSERGKDEVRNLILEAANQLFLEVGYDKTTMRAIAKQIGYNEGTAYYYFKNKEELFLALQLIAFTAFNNAIREAAESVADPVERMTKMGRAYIRFALENPSYYDLMFIMREPMNCLPSEESWENGERAFHTLKETVKECMALGALPQRDPDGVALMIWATMHGLVSLPIRERMTMFDEADLDFLIRDAFAAFDQVMLGAYRLKSTS